jgi:hypothetical protein
MVIWKILKAWFILQFSIHDICGVKVYAYPEGDDKMLFCYWSPAVGVPISVIHTVSVCYSRNEDSQASSTK